MTDSPSWVESKIAVPRSEVELAIVLSCGQSFRWYGLNNLEWIGVFDHCLWVLSQTDTEINYKVFSNQKRSKEEYDNLLHEYFQLDICLSDLYKEWTAKDLKFASLTECEYQGIRILKQDPIENIFSFICSSNNNISRITQMVEKMCVNYGEKITTFNGKLYYDFPTVQALCKDGVEAKFKKESFGYRAGFIANSAKMLKEKGDNWIRELKTMGYEEARRELQSLPGVGRKVADCVCLMSLSYPQAIPVDTHIHQVAKQYLPHIAKAKTLSDKIYNEITDFFRSIHGEYAGWAQSVLFSSRLKHLKGVTSTNRGKKRPTEKLKKSDLSTKTFDSLNLETKSTRNNKRKRV